MTFTRAALKLATRLTTTVSIVLAFGCFVGVVALRQGPPSSGDTLPLTAVTTDLAHGDLHSAASVNTLPDPPGYPLLAALFVASLGSVVGSPRWCTTEGRAAALTKTLPASERETLGNAIAECGFRVREPDGRTGAPLPPWYRSQGLLGVAAWLVLAAGSLSLLRASRLSSRLRETALLGFLIVLPAASSAIVQLYHPEDMACLGLSLGALSAALRSKWVLAGGLFGFALLTKQFAVLVMLPVLLCVVPRGRRMAGFLGGTVVCLVLGIAPFLLESPTATLENLSGIGHAGAVVGTTVVSLLGVRGTALSIIARGAPVALAAVVCIWIRRVEPDLRDPARVVGLVLVCLSGRLVFESVVFPYYLLAASAVIFCSDLIAHHLPYRSLTWCAAAGLFEALSPPNRIVNGIGTFVLAIAAICVGVDILWHPRALSTARLVGPAPRPAGDSEAS